MLQSIHARWRYDKYRLLLNSRPVRSFLEGDTVAVSNGGRGRFISTNEDGSITVEMEDSLTHITWMSAASARLRHSPPLLLYVSEPAQCNTATIVERRLIRKR